MFADVGCDHGYVAEKAIDDGIFDKVIISDISEKCLKKAEERLSVSHSGKFSAYVSDGFDNLPHVDEALISGMGGEVMTVMLSRRKDKPERLVLQPMKNAEKLRLFLINNGYKIVRDYTFKDWKYYHVVVAEKSDEKDVYTKSELTFGRDNLKEKSEDFQDFIKDKIKVFEEAANNACYPEKEQLEQKVAELKEILK